MARAKSRVMPKDQIDKLVARRKNGENDTEEYQRTMIGYDLRRVQVARLYLRGTPAARIAEIFDTTRTTIQNDLAAIRAMWMASAVLDFDTRRAQELAKVDELEAEAWAGYRRSQSDKRSISKLTKDVPIKADADGEMDYGKQIEKRYSREQRSGNHFYLELVLKCIERRCKIIGIDAPERSELSMQLTAAQRTQVEFVDRVVANPAAVRYAHTILELTALSSESASNPGRPGSLAERGPVDAGPSLDTTVDALVRASGGQDSWPDSGDAAAPRQE